MVKIVEFKDVYLEYPDGLELDEESYYDEIDNDFDIDSYEDEEDIDYENIYQEAISRTQKLSLDELQRRLEETQSLHL